MIDSGPSDEWPRHMVVQPAPWVAFCICHCPVCRRVAHMEGGCDYVAEHYDEDGRFCEPHALAD